VQEIGFGFLSLQHARFGFALNRGIAFGLEVGNFRLTAKETETEG
jgi:hypothetical protein